VARHCHWQRWGHNPCLRRWLDERLPRWADDRTGLAAARAIAPSRQWPSHLHLRLKPCRRPRRDHVRRQTLPRPCPRRNLAPWPAPLATAMASRSPAASKRWKLRLCRLGGRSGACSRWKVPHPSSSAVRAAAPCLPPVGVPTLRRARSSTSLCLRWPFDHPPCHRRDGKQARAVDPRRIRRIRQTPLRPRVLPAPSREAPARAAPVDVQLMAPAASATCAPAPDARAPDILPGPVQKPPWPLYPWPLYPWPRAASVRAPPAASPPPAVANRRVQAAGARPQPP
jgi:hypothetical protein